MNALVVELNNYHTETFPVYEQLLPSFLGTDRINWHYLHMPEKSDDLSDVYLNLHCAVSRFGYFIIRNTGLRVPVFTWKINRLLSQLETDILVFNSIEPERNRDIFRTVKARVKIALIHNPERFNLKRNENEYYFVLSRTVYETFRDSLPLSGYLLPYFKPYAIQEKERSPHVTTVGIQGWVNFKRRDYAFLIDQAKELKKNSVDSVRFNIIGANNSKGGKRLREMISENSLSDYFTLHEKLTDKEFYNEIAKCDILMPLLGREQEKYFRKKISSTLSHAAAYGKPLLLTSANAEAWDLPPDSCCTYTDLSSCTAILKAAEGLDQKKKSFETWKEEQIRKNREFLTAQKPD